jgi:tRNA (mo5U34)-methyltransferase
MIDYYASLYESCDRPALQPWLSIIPAQLNRLFSELRHGDLEKWRTIVEHLPTVRASTIDLNCGSIRIGGEGDCDLLTRKTIEKLLRTLHPWRKGPYEVHGVFVDAEWRSDLKWDRLRGHIQPLNDRWVLDVGCGNGYHCWRIAGCGARQVIGIDPTLLSVMQFHAIKHFAGPEFPVYVLPFGIEDVPRGLKAFDSVFSMGILYHRRSPIDHLLELRDCLRPGGELILETLVIDGRLGETLLPEGRYAKMRNVWFIPSPFTLASWLKRCGFKNVRLIDVSRTTTCEQRSTDWMRFQSLADFLDLHDPNRTCEGLPAPKRAIFLADSP